MDIRSWVSAHPTGHRQQAIGVIASACEVTPAAVRHWVAGLRKVPAEHVLTIEARTGVSRHVLRPDVFGPAAEQGAEAPTITKRALLDRLAMKSDTSLAVMLGLPRETVEGWSDDQVLPHHPSIEALLREPAAEQAIPEDADADRIVPVESA